MHKSELQTKHFTILYSIGSQPFANWANCVNNGCIRRITDKDINSFCIELLGQNVSTCYMVSPPPNSKYKSLGKKIHSFIHSFFLSCLTFKHKKNFQVFECHLFQLLLKI
jgi:hypothetical protein